MMDERYEAITPAASEPANIPGDPTCDLLLALIDSLYKKELPLV